MHAKASDRRLIENEKLFRERNELTHRGFSEINRLAQEDNQPEFAVGDNTELAFFCECSNMHCTDHIRMSIRDYSWIHRDVDQFIVLPSHQVVRIERVVARRPGYYVVRKLHQS